MEPATGRRLLKAASLYFALVFGAGFVLGMIRVPFLVPRLGVRWAELIEMPLMLVVIVVAARAVCRRTALPAAPGARLSMGFGALALLVAAELALAVVLQGQTLPQYVASRDPVSGSVYLGMLVLFAAMPLLLARWASPAGATDASAKNLPSHVACPPKERR